jgi:YegS/Rv2252/BmrU family lipid kinase
MEQLVTEGGAVIYNPVAGRKTGAAMLAQARELMGPGWEWIPTQRPGHAVELARQAAQRNHMVVGYGGDGTVGDVARGIYGTEATLGVLPVGTGNDFARNLNLRLDLPEATATVLGGNLRRIDIGLINGTPFINNCGTGFDAQVMRTMNQSIRFTKGRLAFYLAIAKTFPSFKPFRLELETSDGEKYTDKAMMVSALNGKVYAAGMMAAPYAEMDDGLIDILIIKALPKAKLLPLISLVAQGKHLNHSGVVMMKARKFSLKTIPSLPLNIDGEINGLTPMDVTMVPRGLKVLVR